MSEHRISAVLFDYGGVLAEEGFRNGLLALAEQQSLNPQRVLDTAKAAIYDSGFVLGSGTAADFWAQMRAGCGLLGSDETLTELILQGFRLRPWMIELVRQLRAQGYITAILSDQTCWLDQLDRRDHFFHEFDRVFNSYHLGKGKRDRSLYFDIAKKISLSADQILFIDDIRNNFERARLAGWNAIHYRDRGSFYERMGEFIPLLATTS